jgi:hypothetical protein
MALDETHGPEVPHIIEIAKFLVAMAMVLRETVMRFEETATRVTESLVTRAGEADRDLIMTLQDFDRLQQEFATLADVLVQAAAKSSTSWLRTADRGHPAEDALATITIHDLKERLMRQLGISLMDWTSEPAPGDEAVF